MRAPHVTELGLICYSVTAAKLSKAFTTSSWVAPMAMTLKKAPSFSATAWQMLSLAPFTSRFVTAAGSSRSIPSNVMDALDEAADALALEEAALDDALPPHAASSEYYTHQKGEMHQSELLPFRLFIAQIL